MVDASLRVWTTTDICMYLLYSITTATNKPCNCHKGYLYLMKMITEVILFIAFISAFIALPGYVLLHYLRIQDRNVLILFSLSTGIGIVVFTFLSLLIRVTQLPWDFLWILPLGTWVYTTRHRLSLNKNEIWSSLSKISIPLVIIFCLAILQSLNLLKGGIRTKSDLLVASPHDSMWNIAITEELTHSVLPQHPGFAGELLKNNHFYYPLFLAGIKEITHLPTLNIYYNFTPLLVALLFGTSIYCVTTVFFASEKYSPLVLIFGYLAGSVSYLVPLVKKQALNWQGNTFFADQPFDQLTNPYTVLGFAYILLAVYALARATRSQFDQKWLTATAILIGPLYGFKSFGGVIGSIAFVATCLFLVFKLKSIKQIILPFTLFLLMFIPTVFITSDLGKTSLTWIPGWLLIQMMASSEKLNYPKFEEIITAYRNAGFMKGLFLQYSLALGIYLIGNLGIRILGLLYGLYATFKTVRKGLTLQNTSGIFMLITITLGLLIPLLFNMRGSPFNIIQFTPYALLLLIFPTVKALENISILMSKKHLHVVLTGLMLAFFLLASLPTSLKNILEKINASPNKIPLEEVNALEYIKKTTPLDSVLLINPKPQLDQIYIPALSARRVYYVNNFAEQTLLDASERKEKIHSFFTEADLNLLNELPVDYILLEKKNDLQTIDILRKASTLVFENERYVIFKK